MGLSAARRRLLAVAGSCTAAGALALALSVTLPALGLAIFFAGMLLPARLGLPRRLALGAVVYEVSLLVVTTLLAPTGWAVHPRLLGTILLAAAAVVAAWRADWRLRPLFVAGDGPAVVLAAVAFAVLAVPAVTASDAGLVHRLSYGGDTASHLNITRAVQMAQRPVYHDPPRGLSRGGETYPEGLAIAGGYTTWMVRGGSEAPSTAHFLRDMAYAMAGMFASLTFFGILLLQELLRRRVPDDRLGSATLLAGILFTGFVAVGPAIMLEAFGFQTSVLAIGAILVLLWVAVAPELRDRPTLVLALLALMTMAVAHSWYLLAPAPGVVVLAFAVRHRRHVGLPGWLSAGAVMALAAYPVLNGPGAGHVATGGAVAGLPVPAVAALSLTAVALAAWWRRAWHLDNAGYAFLATGASALICLALAAQQLLTEGPVFAPPAAYYFWKSLYLPVILLASLAAVAVAGELACGRRAAAWALAGLTAAAWMATLNPAGTYAFISRNGPADGTTVAAAIAAYPQGVPAGTDVVAGGRCDVVEAAHTSWWIRHLLMAWTPSAEAAAEEEQEDWYTPEQLTRYARAHPALKIVSYVDEGCPEAAALYEARPDNLTLASASH